MEDLDATAEDLNLPRTTTRKRGKGRATETVITKRELVDDDEKASPLTFAALFDPGPDDANDEIAVRVRCTRTDPNEGMVGYIEDMDATETFIKDTWGGSTFRLDGLNSKGKIIRVRTIKIAGDPVFMSESFDLQWRKSKGLPARARSGEMSAQEVLAMIEERESKRRAEQKEQDEERRRREREDEDRRRREEREWRADQDRQAREWEERKRRDQDESDRRRRQEEDDRERRRREDLQASQAQQQQFMQTLLATVTQQANQAVTFIKDTVALQPKSDSSDMLIKGVQLALQLKDAAGGEGEEDLLQTVVKNLPAMLNGVGNVATKVVREFKGQAAAPVAQTSAEGGLMLPPGPASQKMSEVINRIAAAGGDPEVVLTRIADQLLTAGTKQPAQQVEARPNAPVMDPGPPKSTEEAQPATDGQPTNEQQPAAKPSEQGKVRRLKFGK